MNLLTFWQVKLTALLPVLFGLKLVCKYEMFYKDMYSFN